MSEWMACDTLVECFCIDLMMMWADVLPIFPRSLCDKLVTVGNAWTIFASFDEKYLVVVHEHTKRAKNMKIQRFI